MSDITSEEIDPKRPWIIDPQDAPANLNWVQSLTNPFGETSRLHFTRAWTGLFFTRLLYAVITTVLIGIFAAAGADDPRGLIPPQGTWHLLVLVTALASLVLHVRRLTNARRSPLWAILVIVPVLLGFGGFIVGMSGAAAKYDLAVKVEEMRRDGMRDMEIVRELGLVKTPAEQSAEAADAPEDGDSATVEGASDQAESGPAQGQQGGHPRVNPRDLLPQVDVTEVSQREHALKGGLGLSQIVWVPFSFFVMLWSLFWVGRLPNGGGRIKDRLAVEPTSYEE